MQDGHISTNYSADQILITFTGNPVTAIGGNFYASDGFSGNELVSSKIVVTLGDGSVEEFDTASATIFADLHRPHQQ